MAIITHMNLLMSLVQKKVFTFPVVKHLISQGMILSKAVNFRVSIVRKYFSKSEKKFAVTAEHWPPTRSNKGA